MPVNASYPFLLIRFKAHALYQIQAAAVYMWAVKTQDCCSQKPGRTEHLKTSNETKISSVLPSLKYHSHDSEWKAAKKWLRYIKSRTSFIAQVFYLNRLWFDCAEWITWPLHHLCTEESLNHNDAVWAGRIMRNGYELSVFFIYNQNVLWLVIFDFSGCLKERREINFICTWTFMANLAFIMMSWLTHRSERKWSINIAPRRQQQCCVRDEKTALK